MCLSQRGAKDHIKTLPNNKQARRPSHVHKTDYDTLALYKHHVASGIPASEINSKSGSCPRPLGISVFQDTTIGCWMDSNCPGIQKCCVEPNPVTNSATRICRDPVGIASKKSKSVGFTNKPLPLSRHLNLLPSTRSRLMHRSSRQILLRRFFRTLQPVHVQRMRRQRQQLPVSGFLSSDLWTERSDWNSCMPE